MRTARFFVPETWMAHTIQAFTIPAGPLHKQIVSVLRLKAGDSLSLLTGNGKEADCLITEVNRSSIMGTIVKVTTSKPTTPQVIVCAAVTKKDTYEFVLQKCTELGASAFLPIISERVIKKPTEIPKRWHDIVREASEQSGRTTLAQLHEPRSFTQALSFTEGMIRILMHESGKQSVLPKVHKTSTIALFIGPEGGFTDKEVETAQKNEFHVLTLGSLVLRAETAAIAGTAKLLL